MAFIRLSASALDDFVGPDDGCERKWYLSKRLPYAPHPKTLIGVVGHAVIDRWLSADERGVGPDGEPVDLFPIGWNVATDRWGNVEGEINPLECEIVQNLVTAATTLGGEGGAPLKRVPHRKIEEPITLDYVTPNGNDVHIEGYRDVTVHPAPGSKVAEVWDHKFHGKMKRAKSKKKLYAMPQMRLYALELFERYPDLEGVALKHVVFCTDPQDMRVRVTDAINPVTGSVYFTRPEAMEFKAELLAAADRMIHYRDDVKDFTRVPITSKGSWVCMGCPFMLPCSGNETEQTYVDRMRAWAAEHNVELRNNRGGLSDRSGSIPLPQSNPQEETVSTFANLLARVSPAPAPAPAAPAPAPAPAAPAPAPPFVFKAPAPAPAPAAPVAVRAPVVGGSQTPWGASAEAKKGAKCNACLSSGWNSKGGVCAICVAFSEPNERPDQFHIEHTPGGVLWERKNPDPATAAGLTDTSMASLLAQGRMGPLPVTPAPATVSVPPPALIQPTPEQVAVVQQVADAVMAPEIVDPTKDPLGQQQPEAEPEAPRRKAGRPKGAKNKATLAREAAQADAPPAPAPAPADEDAPPGQGFLLFLNCYVQGVAFEGYETTSIDDIFLFVTSTLAQSMGAPSYRALDTWKRRDGLAAGVPALLPMLEGKMIVGKVEDPDTRAFVAALRPHARFSAEGFGVA